MFNIKGRRKVRIVSILLVLVVFIVYFYRPIKFNQIFDVYIREGHPIGGSLVMPLHTANISHFNFSLSYETQKEITSILEDLKLRKTIRGQTGLFENPNDVIIYLPVFRDMNHAVLLRLGREYLIKLTDHSLSSYKIIDNPEFNKIYELIIMDQPEGSLPQYCYDLLEIYRGESK